MIFQHAFYTLDQLFNSYIFKYYKKNSNAEGKKLLQYENLK